MEPIPPLGKVQQKKRAELDADILMLIGLVGSQRERGMGEKERKAKIKLLNIV